MYIILPLIPFKRAQGLLWHYSYFFSRKGKKKWPNENCGKKLKISNPVSLQDDEINQQSQLAEKLKQQMLDQEEVKKPKKPPPTNKLKNPYILLISALLSDSVKVVHINWLKFNR